MIKPYKKVLVAFATLSALLFSPLTTLVAGAAPVPCEYAGGGRHSCRFWTHAPLEGPSDGTLSRGTNWIICQARGRTVTVNGWSNNWWAWTLRDSGTGTYGNGWGWVNAVYATDGDDLEGFEGVPLCYGPPGPPQDPIAWRL